MEAFECPDYIDNQEDKIVLTHKGVNYDIRKPSALELIDMHEDGKNIDYEKDFKALVLYRIKCLVNLGLSEDVAKSLDINKLKNCFSALSADPVKKK